jgi:hypothetical protein
MKSRNKKSHNATADLGAIRGRNSSAEFSQALAFCAKVNTPAGENLGYGLPDKKIRIFLTVSEIPG